MNPFERANLDRLSRQNKELKQIRDFIIQKRDEDLKRVCEDSIRLMVRILFDIHSADLKAIKNELREDKELIQGLNLEQIVNDEYTRQNNPQRLRLRYDEPTRRKFWQEVFRIEQENSESIRNGAA